MRQVEKSWEGAGTDFVYSILQPAATLRSEISVCPADRLALS